MWLKVLVSPGIAALRVAMTGHEYSRWPGRGGVRGWGLAGVTPYALRCVCMYDVSRWGGKDMEPALLRYQSHNSDRPGICTPTDQDAPTGL